MQTFKYATMLPCAIHLDYEAIDKLFAGYADRADQATSGDRSVWCLRWTANTLTIAFKRKREWNEFAKVFQCGFTTGSASAGARSSSAARPSQNGERPRRNPGFSYMLSFDYLDTG